MSSDSDTLSSSSETDVSDDDLHQNVFDAFKAVKENLNKAGMKSKSASSSSAKDRNSSTTSSRHRLIYSTFTKEDTRPTKKKSSDSSKNKVDDEKVNSFMHNFFIDKSTSKNKNDEIVAYDLTDYNEAATDEGNVENTISYDLSNTLDVNDSEDDVADDGRLEHDKDDTESKNNKASHGKEKIKTKKQNGILSSKLKSDLAFTDVYVDVNPLGKKKHKKEQKVKQKHAEPEIMKKSVITDDFEKQDSIQTTHVSVRQQKKERRLEREKTKGSKWFNMPATELTEERKYDLAVLQMRKALDPKRFYKAHDLKAAPKYFQFGEVVADSTDFYSSRIPKKQRKSTVVEELLADAEFRKFNKRKYEEVQESKRLGKGPYKHMKRLKKRKK